ncbi:acyl-CoA dehydrogenase [Oleiphilus sp. HI0009]|nr:MULTISPECIES: acyl-CoA dehydrogenase family protein [unclassified Oleiphilus]KZX86203.1 acyl-CoA dehydrogenase [Oleiphilus sp. HI0009]KZY70019.1 acyl-CoA dehydrogenase [Oleiphilus sp. HI0066]KZY71585.1 acyl-CoA dehydrogenase [Oleiphilus sp. HI0067]
MIINQDTLNFLLYDVFQAEALTELDAYKDHDRSTFDGVIDTSLKIAQDYFLPHNAKADANEPSFDGESVSTIPEVKEAWKYFTEAGLINARHRFDEGGMQLPALVHSACMGLFTGANPSTAGYPFLTSAASNLIHAFGSETQKSLYLDGMFSGRFAGTMALTEPNVGSSLGDLTTKATPQDDGSYRLKGQKMYISGGDQDITENIIHLVLARVEGAPQGVKGISLFICPKFLLNDDGSLGKRNDVMLAGLLHKMGYRGTTSTVLNFGEKDDCTAFLIGEEGKGLSYMFKMMNEARIGVGLGAAMIGYRGYLESLAFAKDRPQGRKPSNRDTTSAPVNIVEHADVKRMLLAQKVYVEGSLALCLFASKLVDEHEAGGDENALVLLDLLTPVVKSYPSTYGCKANELAIQVLGGSGYIREYPVEQCYRDNRLNPIHEGTHGIQSLDLLGRKLWQKQGLGQQLLMQRVQATLARAKKHERLADLAEHYSTALKTFIETTTALGMALQQGRIDETLANSALYLDVMGRMVVGWLWLDMACAALESDRDEAFVSGKLQAARYFIRWELPEINHLSELLKGFDQTCVEMEVDWF